MSYTKVLADYAVKLKYEDLPKEVIQQVKLLTLHTVGVALASYPMEQAKKTLALAKSWGSGQKESTLFGEGTKVSSVSAAFANGTMADVLDWEDCSWTGHPSACAIPAALAFGERIRASGRELSLRLWRDMNFMNESLWLFSLRKNGTSCKGVGDWQVGLYTHQPFQLLSS